MDEKLSDSISWFELNQPKVILLENGMVVIVKENKVISPNELELPLNPVFLGQLSPYQSFVLSSGRFWEKSKGFLKILVFVIIIGSIAYLVIAMAPIATFYINSIITAISLTNQQLIKGGLNSGLNNSEGILTNQVPPIQSENQIQVSSNTTRNRALVSGLLTYFSTSYLAQLAITQLPWQLGVAASAYRIWTVFTTKIQ